MPMGSKQLAWWTPEVGQAETARVLACLESQYLNEGDIVTEFEKTAAKLLGAKYAIATTSGTAALFLSLKAFGIGHGDEVLVPDLTFIATANAVVMAGATPILVDIDPRTLNIDPQACESRITPKTKAILPVHVSGRGADLPSLKNLARRHKLVVIEDAAEAFLSRAHGACLGTRSEAGCFSFSPNKTITTGQGGLIVTDDENVVTKLKQLKDQGRPVRGTGGDDPHPVVGFNFKMTNLQAAVGMGQIEKLETRTKRLRRHYELYREGLEGVSGVRVLPFESDEVPQWIDIEADRRDELDKFLGSRGMSCRRFWHPLHRQPPYRAEDAAFPVTTRLSPRALWLPSAFQLVDRDIESVCAAIREFYS